MGLAHNQNIAILASGGGSTAEAFIEAAQAGVVQAEVGLVICNKPPEHPEAGVYDRIAGLNEKYGLDIPVVNISQYTHPEGPTERGQTLAEANTICELIVNEGLTHVALMGYMRKVNGDLLAEFGWLPSYDSMYQARMTNTHPGPLPETADTYGEGASRRVLDLGMSASRHTVHLVADKIDDGPIFAAHPVTVIPGDTPQTLFERVQKIEKRALPVDLNRFFKGQKAYYENAA